MAKPQSTDAQIAEMMSAAGDFPDNEPTLRYLILSTPRTGSTLLCRALHKSGHAGHPAEYLNPRYVQALKDRIAATKELSFKAYIKFLGQKRTSPNGVWGINCHYEHLATQLKRQRDHVAFLRSFDKIIVLHRRNKLYQTISYLRALHSDQWKLEAGQETHEIVDLPDPAPTSISVQIGRFAQGEQRISVLVAAVDRPTLHLLYEDLDEDFAAAWRQVSRFLELPELAPETVYPTLKRQRDARTERIAEAYLRYLRGA